jgi:hypothetical protein
LKFEGASAAVVAPVKLLLLV